MQRAALDEGAEIDRARLSPEGEAAFGRISGRLSSITPPSFSSSA